MEDTLIYFGDAIKALDDSGKVGGYLVRFTNPAQKDIEGEYFTSQTYFGARDGDGRDTLFHHGLPIKKGLEALADHVFAPMKTRKDDIGIWAETVLDQSDQYEALVHKLIKAGKIGWSSGSSPHLVKKSADGRLDRWIISEGSLTHMPVDPLAKALPIKSLAGFEQDIEDDIKAVIQEGERKSFSLSGLPGLSEIVAPGNLKAMTEHSESVDAAVEEFITHGSILGDALKAYEARVDRHAEFRFVKDGKQLQASNRKSIGAMRERLEKVCGVFKSIDALLESREKVFHTEKAVLDAMDEQARFELWNFYRISGKSPEEFKNAR